MGLVKLHRYACNIMREKTMEHQELRDSFRNLVLGSSIDTDNCVMQKTVCNFA